MMGIERTIKASSTGEEVEFFGSANTNHLGSLQSLRSERPASRSRTVSYHPQKECPFPTYG